jgi:hypothetical protein
MIQLRRTPFMHDSLLLKLTAAYCMLLWTLFSSGQREEGVVHCEALSEVQSRNYLLINLVLSCVWLVSVITRSRIVEFFDAQSLKAELIVDVVVQSVLGRR